MKKVASAILLSAAISTPALASDLSKLSVGAGYGPSYGGVLSLRADYDISDEAKAPVKARVGYDSYNEDHSGMYKWSYNVFYGGAYYDFNKQLKLDSKLHPFAGLGLGFGSASCSGAWCNGVSTPSVGGLYLIAGVQYDLSPKVNAELNINGWNGLSIGGNFKF